MCGPARNVCVCYGLWKPAHCQFTQLYFGTPGLPVGAENGAYFISFIVMCRSFLLVSLIGNLRVASRVWGGGAGEKKRLQYFEFGLQYLVQPLGVNPTYSTFK